MRTEAYRAAVLCATWAALICGCQRFHSRPLDPKSTAAALESYSLADAGLREFVGQFHPKALDSWPPRTWDLEMLTLAALYGHPELAVARAQWELAKAGIITAGGRPNPTLGITPEYNFNPEHGFSPWIATVDLDIPIETAGKRDYRQAKARHLAAAAWHDALAMAWRIRSELRQKLLQHAATQERVVLLAQQDKIAREMAAAVEAQVKAGAATAGDLRLAQVDALKTQGELAATEREVIRARSDVARILGVPLAALEGLELRFALGTSGHFASDLTSPALRRAALTGRSEIMSALSAYAAAQSALQLEMARQYPDLHLGNGYQWDQGENKWALGLTLELPVLNQNQGPIAEAAAQRAVKAAQVLAAQSRILAELDRAAAACQMAAAQLQEAEAIVAAQEQQLAGAQAELETGAADRLKFWNASRQLGLARLGRLQVLISYHEAIGELESALQYPADAVVKGIENGPFRTLFAP